VGLVSMQFKALLFEGAVFLILQKKRS